jgi:hypothetical protein
MANLGQARNVASGLGVRQFADFTPDFNLGADALRNTVTGQQGLNTVRSGASMAQQAGQYSPQQVSGGSFLDMNLGAYMNPYLQQVAGNTMSDMDRARMMTQNQNADAAASAKAFGGSRQAVLEAETNRNYFDRLGKTLTDIYAGGFDKAAGLAGEDLNRALTAGQSNQAAGLTANEQSLAASKLLGDLGLLDQEMGLQGADALMNLGLGQQELDQARLDAIRNLPLEQQAIVNEALALNVGGGSGMTSSSSGSSKSSSQNGIFKSIGLSDIRAKENIERVGTLPNGLGLYSFDYKAEFRDLPMAGHGKQVGVLAQEVEMVMPGAVVELSNGLKAVDYAQLG